MNGQPPTDQHPPNKWTTHPTPTALSTPPTEEEAALLQRILLEEDPNRLILAVLPVTDVFDYADAVHVAKQVRVASCGVGWAWVGWTECRYANHLGLDIDPSSTNKQPNTKPQQLDPESKRTIGVVTKMQLVTKEMAIVEKLQMTSNKDVVLPLGCVIALSPPLLLATSRPRARILNSH